VRLLMGATRLMLVSGCAPERLLHAIVSPRASAADSTTAAATSAATRLTESFAGYAAGGCRTEGSSFGPWTVRYTGYGCVATTSDDTRSFLAMSPDAASSPEVTHAALVLGPRHSTQLVMEASVQTVTQLRAGSAPNAWEVTWLVWSFRDDDHFYYFIAKPNGWELGKRDPAYPGGQRFLATGNAPATAVGEWRRVRIEQDRAGRVTVRLDGQLVVAFTDKERPYRDGQVGFYTEDAAVRVTDVSLVY
jgi:hypothetical protein